MRVYAPVAALASDRGRALATSRLGYISPRGRGERSRLVDRFRGIAWRGHDSVVQLIIGFFAMAGLVSVDWGARVERRRDVVLGGLTGIVLAASWTAIACRRHRGYGWPGWPGEPVVPRSGR